jgi:hypothetical protein
MNDRLYKDFSKRIITNEHFVNKKGMSQFTSG